MSLVPAPQTLRTIVLGLAIAGAMFCASAILAVTVVRASDLSGGFAATVAISAVFGFMVFTVPSAVLAWYWLALPLAALLALAASILNTALIYFWLLQ